MMPFMQPAALIPQCMPREVSAWRLPPEKGFALGKWCSSVDLLVWALFTFCWSPGVLLHFCGVSFNPCNNLLLPLDLCTDYLLCFFCLPDSCWIFRSSINVAPSEKPSCFLRLELVSLFFNCSKFIIYNCYFFLILSEGDWQQWLS